MLEVIKLERIRFSLPQKHVMVMTLYVPIIVMALGGLGTIMSHTFHVNTHVLPFCVLKIQNGYVIPYGKIPARPSPSVATTQAGGNVL